MLVTLFTGLVMASSTPAMCPTPLVLPTRMGGFYRTQIEEFNKQVTVCQDTLVVEKTKICDREFDRRSSHGEAKFSEKGKKYGKSELTCSITCSPNHYLTKGGSCKKHAI